MDDITIRLDLDGMHVSCADETRHFVIAPLDEDDDYHVEVMINMELEADSDHFRP